jgi:hypothetical protein
LNSILGGLSDGLLRQWLSSLFSGWLNSLLGGLSDGFFRHWLNSLFSEWLNLLLRKRLNGDGFREWLFFLNCFF